MRAQQLPDHRRFRLSFRAGMRKGSSARASTPSRKSFADLVKDKESDQHFTLDAVEPKSLRG